MLGSPHSVNSFYSVRPAPPVGQGLQVARLGLPALRAPSSSWQMPSSRVLKDHRTHTGCGVVLPPAQPSQNPPACSQQRSGTCQRDAQGRHPPPGCTLPSREDGPGSFPRNREGLWFAQWFSRKSHRLWDAGLKARPQTSPGKSQRSYQIVHKHAQPWLPSPRNTWALEKGTQERDGPCQQ